MHNLDENPFREQDVDLIDHINHWLEYLVKLSARTDEETRPKWERQIRCLLTFRAGANCNINHNHLLLHYYNHGAEISSPPAGQAEERNAHHHRSKKPELQAQIDADVGEFLVQFRERATSASMPIHPEKPLQNRYQLDDPAFRLICRALACEDLFFLQGPPGTGKTTAIVEMILQTLHAKPHARILISSESNIAVDNALDRLVGVELSLLDKVLRYPHFTITEFECDAARQADALAQVKELWIRQPALQCELHPYTEHEDGTTSIASWQARNLAEMHQVIGVTCNRIAHLIKDSDAPMFDLAIVDECSKATLPEWLMAMSVAKKCILVGDHKQLPPVFCEEESDVLDEMDDYKERLIRNGVIERLFDNLPAAMKGTLDTQYRMLPAIGEFVSKAFYRGELKNHRTPADVAHEFTQFGWIDYKAGSYRVPAQTGNTRKILINDVETRIAVDILDTISRYMEKKNVKSTLRVALITPYKAQCHALRAALEKQREKHDYTTALDVEVDTVDAFQGREANIVIFSFVRTTGPARFYADPRRMNVAISRAKDAVYLIGDRGYIKSKHLEVLDKLLVRPTLIKYEKNTEGHWQSNGSCHILLSHPALN